MANVSAPRGFVPVKSSSGEARLTYFTVGSASARIFEGDLVLINTATGCIIKATAVSPTVMGVAAKGSGAITASIANFPVYNDPSTIFEAEYATAVLAQTAFGNRYRVTQTAGDTTTNLSKQSVSSTASATGTILLLRLVNRPDNTLAASSKVECVIAKHQLNA